ncbi:hypothetical protein BDZ85DRAFT_199363 [Elsinoe ampelina]|uniref:Uncharacterized protein n=1 Tax=Elsinoe ampelina TaxID=302913 RepID=A0A6A6G953_9PEZI|nr:hypothetical protein BDZ85DRAFT_199363 [Elsinoe ampelina]
MTPPDYGTKAGPPSPELLPNATRTFLFDFKWSNLKTRIIDSVNPEGPPSYIGDFTLLAWRPKVYLKSADESNTIATGTLYNFHINTSVVIHGQEIKIEAAKRLTTHYVYPSTTLSSTGKPQTMTWRTTFTAKFWHFHLLDDNQAPIARYSVDWWALKKFAKLEIMGEYSRNDKAVEEILATAFTVYGCMLYRSNNLFNLLGAAVHKKPKTKDITDDEVRQAAKDDWEMQQRGESSAVDAPPAYARPGKGAMGTVADTES